LDLAAETGDRAELDFTPRSDDWETLDADADDCVGEYCQRFAEFHFFGRRDAARFADVVVVNPGWGDSVQANKAGLMEIADIFVINKADHPLADTMIREIRGVLSLAPQRGWRPPIVKTEATRGEGIDELVEKLDRHRAFILEEGTLHERRRRNLRNEVLALATARMRRRLEEELREDPEFQRLLDEVVSRRLDPASAAETLMSRTVDEEGR